MTITENIWTEYHRKLLSFVKRRVNDETMAEDIVQEIFIKIHTRIDSLKDTVKLESWLYQIARNTVYDYYRTHKPSEKLPEQLVQADIEDNVSAKQELESCLESMINQLSDKYRDSVYLSEITGLNQQEVADKQSISLSGAKSRVQRGRKLLKGLLHECCEIELNKNNHIVDFSKKPGKSDCCK
jgi:RNA polymerase sigma-70 factor (ECF subfamily)